MSAAPTLAPAPRAPRLPGLDFQDERPFKPWFPLPDQTLDDVRDQRLTYFDFVVLAAVVRRCGRGRRETWTLNEQLAEDLGAAEQSIRVSLRRLEEAGYLTRVGDRYSLSRRRIEL